MHVLGACDPHTEPAAVFKQLDINVKNLNALKLTLNNCVLNIGEQMRPEYEHSTLNGFHYVFSCLYICIINKLYIEFVFLISPPDW